MAQASFAVKRATPRYPFFAAVEATLGDGTWLPAQLSELSARGCYIDTLKPIPVGTELHLRICDGAITCDVNGKVIYMQSGGGLGVFGMGVVFAELGAEQHTALDAWLRELAGKSANAPC
jgi:hypothetical protein